MLRMMASLACVTVRYIDCCINSCMAYTGQHEGSEECNYCGEARFEQRGTKRQAKRVFCYIPLIHQLLGLYQSKDTAALMWYRSKFERKGPDIIRDVFDGAIYQKLCRHRVVLDGEKQDHRYFEDPHDVAFSVCTDGFLLFQRRRSGPSATPILIQNYNLPPAIRTHANNLICVGVIPGPKQPKDLASFRQPLEEECAKLAGEGIKGYDASTKKEFTLRAYQIFELADIVALEKSLGIKGHNAFCPCRNCLLTGIRGGAKVYYIPLRIPKELKPTQQQNDARSPFNIKLRTHEGFKKTLADMEEAETVGERDAIAKKNGIRRAPSFGTRVGSLNFAKSAPWDWMHLLLENIIPNLVKLWTGGFKGLDTGKEDYEIDPAVWEQIGKETAEAVKGIPAAFVRVLKDIAKERSHFTAESWCFWFLYLAPILLRKRFQHEKYYTHMCDLVKIMKTTLKFSVTSDELDSLEGDIIEWVEKYER